MEDHHLPNKTFLLNTPQYGALNVIKKNISFGIEMGISSIGHIEDDCNRIKTQNSNSKYLNIQSGGLEENRKNSSSKRGFKPLSNQEFNSS